MVVPFCVCVSQQECTHTSAVNEAIYPFFKSISVIHPSISSLPLRGNHLHGFKFQIHQCIISVHLMASFPH